MKKVGNLLILVRPQEKKIGEKKIGSIIVPTTVRHKKELTEGLVIQCGLGTPDIPMEVRPSDRIMFHLTEDLLQVEDCYLLKMEHVLFVLP